MTRPLYILSFRQRDELAELAAGDGWHVVATRRADDAARRFSASGAQVAVLDARGALEDAIAAAPALAQAAGKRGSILMVLVSRGDVERLEDFAAAGATDFLASPFAAVEFRQALRFAARSAERRGRPRAENSLGWRYDSRTRLLTLTPALALATGVEEQTDLAAFAVLLPHLAADQRESFAAGSEGVATAVAHDLPGIGRVVSHVQQSDEGLAALIEPIQTVPDADRIEQAFSHRDGDELLGFLGRDLERALAADEIEMLFQPQVEIASNTVIGAEALMRWRHPRLGELGAEALLEAADRAGLAAALSTYVQERSLADAAAWPKALSHLRLSLNITAEDLAEPDFVDRFVARVASSGFPLDRLTAEVTERGLIANPPQTAQVLAALRDRGMCVAIDDFGTGYSSLAYLSQLPLDYLKLDKVLTHGVVGSQRDRVVVRGVIQMALSLDIAVIAEGVETDQQRDLIAREGCRYYQGFLCAGPLTSAGLVRVTENP